MELKAVFFDLDGTLSETEPLHLDCFNYAFKKHNLPFHWDPQLYSLLLSIGGGVERISYYLKLISFSLNQEDILSLHQTKTKCYQEALKNPIKLRPGIVRLIQELNQNNILTALVTTSSKTATESFIKSSLPPFLKFDLILTGDDVQNKKPHPEIYQKALECLSLNPREVITIEDSRMGLLSAHSNHIKVLITPSHYTKREHFQEAYSVISDLGEPNQPFIHLSNHPLSKNYVDLEVLQNCCSS
ncbi:MAG: HAD-IA family hydrolase [Leptonema sp. (in: bacteria)]